LCSEPNDLRSEPNDLRSEPNDLCSEPNDLCSEPTDLRFEPNDLRSEPTDLCSEPTDLRFEPNDLRSEPTDLRFEPNDLHLKTATILGKTVLNINRDRFKTQHLASDKIIPGDPSLDKTKKDVYPVFQWVCSYEIQRKEENSSDFQQNSFHTIDLYLEPYCENRAAEDGTNRKKPTHHYYNDPYSLYCADPRSKRMKK